MEEYRQGMKVVPAQEIADLSKGEYQVWSHFASNLAPKTWRERVAYFFRGMAQVFDGDTSLSIRMLSIPPLSKEAQTRIVIEGVNHMKGAFATAVVEEGREVAYRTIVRNGLGVEKYYSAAREQLDRISKAGGK